MIARLGRPPGKKVVGAEILTARGGALHLIRQRVRGSIAALLVEQSIRLEREGFDAAHVSGIMEAVDRSLRWMDRSSGVAAP